MGPKLKRILPRGDTPPGPPPEPLTRLRRAYARSPLHQLMPRQVLPDGVLATTHSNSFTTSALRRERVCSGGCKRTSTSPCSWPLIARGRERVAGLAANENVRSRLRGWRAVSYGLHRVLTARAFYIYTPSLDRVGALCVCIVFVYRSNLV